MARKGNKKNKKPLKIINLDPSQKIREIKNKIFNFFENYKKEKEKAIIRSEKKKKLEEKKELIREKKEAKKNKLNQIKE